MAIPFQGKGTSCFTPDNASPSLLGIVAPDDLAAGCTLLADAWQVGAAQTVNDYSQILRNSLYPASRSLLAPHFGQHPST
jgi:hypothetical protein